MVYNIISIRRSVQKLSYCAIMDFWLAAPFWGWDAGQIVAPWAMVICIEASEKHNKRNCEPASIECCQIYYELLPHENLIMHYQKWRAEETSIHQSMKACKYWQNTCNGTSVIICWISHVTACELPVNCFSTLWKMRPCKSWCVEWEIEFMRD